MSEAAIRAQIKTDLESVSGIGVVHDRQRFSRSWAEWFKLMTSDGVVNGWTIHRQATPGTRANVAQVEREHSFAIFGVYNLDDENNSEATFQALIESIFAVFRDDPTLNDTALETDPLNVDDVDVEEYGGRLYHVCDLTLTAREREDYS